MAQILAINNAHDGKRMFTRIAATSKSDSKLFALKASALSSKRVVVYFAPEHYDSNIKIERI